MIEQITLINVNEVQFENISFFVLVSVCKYNLTQMLLVVYTYKVKIV